MAIFINDIGLTEWSSLLGRKLTNLYKRSLLPLSSQQLYEVSVTDEKAEIHPKRLNNLPKTLKLRACWSGIQIHVYWPKTFPSDYEDELHEIVTLPARRMQSTGYATKAWDNEQVR